MDYTVTIHRTVQCIVLCDMQHDMVTSSTSHMQMPTFGLILQHHVRDLKQFEGKGHLPVGSHSFQQARQQGSARHLVVTKSCDA